MTLTDIFGNKPIPKAIDFFRVNQFWDYSIRDVATDTHTSYRTLQKVIPQLVRKGITKFTRVEGKAKLYQFNKESRLATELQEIARESDLLFGEKLAQKTKEKTKALA